MQIPFVKSTIFENCRNVNINMKYSVKIHGDTSICNEGKYVWICYSKKFLMRWNEIVNRYTWKMEIDIINNFSCIEIWILRSYSRKCGQICRNFIVFGLGISLFRNKRFVLNEMFQQNTSKFAIFFWNMKTHVVFYRFSFGVTLFLPLMNALVYVNIDQGIH